MSVELVRRFDAAPFKEVDLTGVQTLAKALFDSGFFDDVKSVAEAGVKILAGAEIGLAPIESMRAFHVIQGKLEFSAHFLAQRVRQHAHYNYKVLRREDLTNERCEIHFFYDDDEIGVSCFDEEDRERAGLNLETARGELTTWAKYPNRMMFARAMSQGVAFFCPDVVAGVPGLIDAVRPFAVLPDDDPADPTVIEIGNVAADTSSAEPGGSGEDPKSSGDREGSSPDAAPVGSRGNRGEVATRAEGSRDPEAELPSGHDGSIPSTATSVSPSADRRKATKAQKSKLILLAQERGWDDDERHRRAEVESFNDLTKQAASLLIQAWEADEERGPAEGVGRAEDVGGSSPPAPSAVPESDPNAEPTEEFRRRAIRLLGSESAIVVMARKFYPKVGSFESITAGQLARTLEAYLHRNDCGHALVNREESGFCRRCGQMVGEPPL